MGDSTSRLAIVGVGCRFPGGVDGPAALWRLLEAGVDAVSEVPKERWSVETFFGHEPRRGRTQAKWGGFVSQAFDEIDAAFFGMSPREAAHLSPMQRWLLESCWDALEDAGIAPRELAGSNTGVFVGGFVEDAVTLAHADSNREFVDMHTGTGVAISILSNRISYLLDVHGPSMTVDTACSSSLVATHLAAQAIASGQCSIAIVGGANAMLKPEFNIAASQANMLSPTGRSRAFSARADGYTRAEGAGVVVVMPLEQAVSAGHPIYACIRATGVNQDGRTTGITVPNAEAQARLIREVYGRAGVRGADVSYIEAHGTGTPVGDPLEMKALDAVLRDGRPSGERCPVGSIKTNFGHAEGAAGVAALIKAALVLRHGRIPPNLHFDEPSTQIPWADLCTRVPTASEPLVRRGATALVGVNSFGFGGTNAHVLLEEAPPGRPVPERAPSEAPWLAPVSAASPEALRALAGRYAAWLDGEGATAPLPDVCATLATRRDHHAHRAAIIASSTAQLQRELRQLAAGAASDARRDGRVGSPRVVFVYTGMGPQWWAMGRELHAEEPVFRAAIDACDARFRHHAGWSLTEALLAPEASSRMARTEVAQPANFALQVGLTELLRAWGVVPWAVVGHSVGEVASAWASGALSLDHALLVSYQRSRVQQTAAGRGTMLAASLSVEDAVDVVQASGGEVSLAAVNSPVSVTLAGNAEALRRIEVMLQTRGTFSRLLHVDVAYHSHQMDPLEAELRASLAALSPRQAQVPLYSTVTADRLPDGSLDADYWWRNVRQTVRFADTIARLSQAGADTFVQLGPHPVLGAAVHECLRSLGAPGVTVPTLRRGAGERASLLGAVGALWTLGTPLAWRDRIPAAPTLPLPTYPWQRRRYWFESDESRKYRTAAASHPLLGRRTDAPVPTWEQHLGDAHAYLRDHKVQGAVVFPAAGFLEMAFAAARDLHGSCACELTDVRLRKALFLPEGDASVRTRLVLEPESGRFDIFGSTGGQRPWVHHVSGTLRPLPVDVTAPRQTPAALGGRVTRAVDPEALYLELARSGLEYGPAFRVIAEASRGERESVARLRLRHPIAGSLVSPPLLDGALQALAALLADPESERGEALLPVSIERVMVFGATPAHVTAYGRVTPGGGEVRLIHADGSVLVDVRGLQVRPLAAPSSAEDRLRDAAYVWRWQRAVAPGATSAAALSPSELVAAIQPGVDEIAHALDHAARVRSGNAILDRIALAYIVEALEIIGFTFTPRARVTEPALAEQLRIAPAQRSLFGSLLAVLIEAGALGREGDGLRVVARLDVGTSAELFREAFAARPDFFAELELLRRCGASLPDVLWGRVEPLSLVFAKDTLTSEQFYQDAPSLRLNNLMVRETLAALAAALTPGRRLRVLEVGAGTGATSAHVLPALSSETASYVYTDVTATFVTRGRERFGALAFVEFAKLDIGQDPRTQGFDASSFDVIVATNVLHATADLRCSLANVASLLAPGGLLLMTEITRMPRMVTLTFGQLRDWWSFTDRDVRRDGPCLGFDAWSELLEAAGFEDVNRFRDPAGEAASLVLARRAAAPARGATGGDRDPSLTGRWIVIADGELGLSLSQAIRARGSEVELMTIGDRSPEQFGKEFASSLAHAPARAVVHLGAVDAVPSERLDSTGFAQAQQRGTYTALRVLQALESCPVSERPSVWLATRGAVAVAKGRELTALAHAPMWGLGRVAISEHPETRLRLVDLDPTGDPRQALLDELSCGDDEHETAWRSGVRYVHRLERAPWSDLVGPGASVSVDDTGRARAAARVAPGPGQVEVKVAAAGVDGGELAGEVVQIGTGVHGWRQGDRVVGLAAGPIATYQLCSETELVALPPGVSPEAAAALPRAYLVIEAGLRGLVPVAAGEWVAVADATSAIGLLALAELRAVGAHAIAVAGSATGRDLLRALGHPRVVDAKASHVDEEILRQSGGRHVDVVLHPGSGEAAPADLARALRPLGRFVAAGEALVAGDLGAQLVTRSLVFLPVTPDALVAARSPVVAQALSSLASRLADGSLQAPPYRTLPLWDIPAARSPERRARCVGTQVVALEHPRTTCAPACRARAPVRDDSTYLITGGLSGVGLETARWLVSRGARQLVLVGRSGAATDEARAGVAALERRGVRVSVARVDVSDEDQVRTLLERIDRELPPLRGIVHGAMVLDDGLISQLTPERFANVLAPKALGALNLHRLTRDRLLDFFVLYSSIASVGLQGQANYVAANVFLDALAHARAAEGLPSLAINWGVIGQIGYVSRNAQLYGYFDQLGMRSITPREIHDALGHYLGRSLPQVFVAPIDWARLAGFAPILVRSPRFAALVPKGETPDQAPAASLEASRLQAIRQCSDPLERKRLLGEFVAQVVGAVLGLDASQVDQERPITDLGLDSLLALQLSGRLEGSLGVSLPVARLLAGASVAQISGSIG